MFVTSVVRSLHDHIYPKVCTTHTSFGSIVQKCMPSRDFQSDDKRCWSRREAFIAHDRE